MRKKIISLTAMLLFAAITAFAYPFPDTGQSKCYNNTVEIPCPLPGEPFYRQDAQYTCNPQSYTDLGNGIVQDNVTGLMWQQATALGTYSWQQAMDYCDALSIGGYDDWRLPTIKELSTLVDSSIPDPGPTINTSYFLGTVASYYWSSTTYAGNTNGAWYVYFGNGGVSYYNKYSNGYARAVRGGPSGSFGNLVINGDGTVSDTTTGLMWQQATAPGTYTWEQALTYCENLTLSSGGYSDWRLPNRNELQSIVDYTRYEPSIDTVAFPDTEASNYWSSTTCASNTNFAWLVDLGYSFVWDGYGKSNGYYVRAVRGGLCGSFGDLDGDGILDDGDNSSIVGDNPCTGEETINCDDNCLQTFNPDQADADSDGVGDLCDNCPNDNNTNQSNIDGDNFGDVCDPCPNDPDNDIDHDTICGDVDVCPNDPTNDTDNDTICGLVDNCPQNPNSSELGTCIKIFSGVYIGTGIICLSHSDCEVDGLCQKNQEDYNGNGIGDACECYADLSGDGKVNSQDLLIMKLDYNRKDCFVNPCNADCNDDGKVNSSDLLIMKTQYNRNGCPVIQ